MYLSKIYFSLVFVFLTVSCTKSNSDLPGEYQRIQDAEVLLNDKSSSEEVPTPDEVVENKQEEVLTDAADSVEDIKDAEEVDNEDAIDNNLPVVNTDPPVTNEEDNEVVDTNPVDSDHPENNTGGGSGHPKDIDNDHDSEVVDNNDNDSDHNPNPDDVVDNSDDEDEESNDNLEDPIIPVPGPSNQRFCWAEIQSNKIVNINVNVKEIDVFSKDPKVNEHNSCHQSRFRAIKINKQLDFLDSEKLLSSIANASFDIKNPSPLKIKFSKVRKLELLLIGIYKTLRKEGRGQALQKVVQRVVAENGGEPGILAMIKKSHHVVYEDGRVCPLFVLGNQLTVSKEQRYLQYENLVAKNVLLSDILIKKHKFGLRLNKRTTRGYIKSVFFK